MNDNNFLVFRMFGGTGNQFFQYAHGRALSLSVNKKLILDNSFYKDSTIDFHWGFKGKKSKYNLNQFTISNDVELIDDCYEHSYRFYKYILNYLPTFIKKKFFNSSKYNIKKFNFEKILFNQSKTLKKEEDYNSSYYLGYWQSTKYFKNYEKILKKELQLKNIKSGVKKFTKSIKSNMVAIHVRGGDVLTLKDNTYVAGNTYYYKVIQKLKKEVPNIKYHFFSDDLVYLEKIINSLEIKNYKIISKLKKFTDLEEFFIMQNYKYLVISASTFSWWAAWLGNKKDNKIFSPKIWVNGKDFPKELKFKNLKLI